MNRTKQVSMITRAFATYSAASACLLLGSCASTTDSPATPPPPGSAIVDAMPDAEHRQHIEGIELVSINGRSVQGTRSVIKPGPNTVKTRFRWPQGQVQKANLRFYATPGTIYFINYDVYPPAKELTNSVGVSMLNSMGEGVVLIGPPAVVIGIGERIAHGVAQSHQTATYIDLTVVAHHSSQGTVRQVRAYPDGRVDEKPWAAWAQMKAP